MEKSREQNLYCLRERDIENVFDVRTFFLQTDSDVLEVVSCEAINQHSTYFNRRTFVLNSSDISSHVTTRRARGITLFQDVVDEMNTEIEMLNDRTRTSLVFKQTDVNDLIRLADSDSLRNAYNMSGYTSYADFCSDYPCDKSNFGKWFRNVKGSAVSEEAVRRFLFDLVKQGEEERVKLILSNPD